MQMNLKSFVISNLLSADLDSLKVASIARETASFVVCPYNILILVPCITSISISILGIFLKIDIPAATTMISVEDSHLCQRQKLLMESRF